MSNFPYADLEKKLGYQFKDKALLKEAFTHSTYANMHGGKDNERMEYLGDAVLQLVVTEWQYFDNAKAEEGELTRQRQKYVCGDALDEAVRGLGLEKYLLLEGGRANVGKKTVSSLFETVVAAIYLDGGYEPAKTFIVKHGRLETEEIPTNYKGELQESLQRRGLELPKYQAEKTGKDNAPVFTAVATAEGESASGQGGSKKEAEQFAAKALIEKLRQSNKLKK